MCSQCLRTNAPIGVCALFAFAGVVAGSPVPILATAAIAVFSSVRMLLASGDCIRVDFPCPVTTALGILPSNGCALYAACPSGVSMS